MRFCHQLDYATSGVLVIIILTSTVLAHHFLRPEKYSLSLGLFIWSLILALFSYRCGLIIGRLQTLSESNSVKGFHHTTTTTTTTERTHIPPYSTIYHPQLIPCLTFIQPVVDPERHTALSHFYLTRSINSN